MARAGPGDQARVTIRTGFGPGGGGQFAIADTGPGIAAQARAGLFRPFFLSKLKGMGVSLPVLRRPIESHGHAIEAESGPGAGAAVHSNCPDSDRVAAGLSVPHC